jgi:hypothetical protein
MSVRAVPSIDTVSTRDMFESTIGKSWPTFFRHLAAPPTVTFGDTYVTKSCWLFCFSRIKTAMECPSPLVDPSQEEPVPESGWRWYGHGS